MSLYAGYFAAGFGLDPTGLKECSQKVIVSIKSYIASIAGTGVNQGPAADWTSNQKIGLRAFLTATELSYNENPVTGDFSPFDGKVLDARFASKREFNITYDDVTNKIKGLGNILPQHIRVKGGSEPANLALTSGIVNNPERPMLTVTDDKITFSWFVKARPPVIVESVFLAVKFRKSVYIWHEIAGEITIVEGKPTVSISTFKGSQFPTHRRFIKIGNGEWDSKTIPQGHISELWTSSPNDETLVK